VVILLVEKWVRTAITEVGLSLERTACLHDWINQTNSWDQLMALLDITINLLMPHKMRDFLAS